LSGQASGGSLADEDNKDFGHSNMGAKAGFAFVNTADFSAGIFAGFGSRQYKQDANKAVATDFVDFLFAGNKPEYSAKPHYENDEAKTKAAKSQTTEGTDEAAASFGLGIGASLPVSGSVDIFANADAKMNADYFGYQANVGAAFKF
jgi:hypothetical protein